MSTQNLFNHPFGPTLLQLQPYIEASQENAPLFNTAYKALYTFLCKIVRGNLDLQLRAIQWEHETDRDVDFPSEANKMEAALKETLNFFRSVHQGGERLDSQLFRERIQPLKDQAQEILKIPVRSRWKWQARCCCCC